MFPEFTIIDELTLDVLSQNSVSCLLLSRSRQRFSLKWASKEKQLLALHLYLCIVWRFTLKHVLWQHLILSQPPVLVHQLSSMLNFGNGISWVIWRLEEAPAWLAAKHYCIHCLHIQIHLLRLPCCWRGLWRWERVLFRLRLQSKSEARLVGHAPTLPTCLCGAVYKPAATCKSRWGQCTSGQQVFRNKASS